MMIDSVRKDNFNALVELAMKREGVADLRSVVEKELLHYDLLFVLDDHGLLDRLTFQGGTSLRLCYGAPRLSEDLDFAGGKDFQTSYLLEMKSCIEKYVGERYGLIVNVKDPKEISLEPNHEDIKVDQWQISVITAPEKKDIPQQKIKIQIANIPAYTRVPLALQQNYDFLPDGYSDTIVLTESLDEIMSDKLVSLVNTDIRKRIRHRDIWDLRWLKQKGAEINSEFILAKISDYKITDYLSKLNEMIEHIDAIIKSEKFSGEMSRFIPMNDLERTLKKDKFKEYLVDEIKSMLLEVKQFVN